MVDVLEKLKDEARGKAEKRGKRLIDDLTDAEFREAAHTAWLNAFSCINPSDEFLIEVDRMVVHALRDSEFVDSLIGQCPHVVMHFSKS